MAKIKTKTQGKNRQRFSARFTREEIEKLKIDPDLTPKDVSNAVREKLGFEPLVSQRVSKKKLLAKELGLPETATMAEIQNKMLEKLKAK